MHACKQLIALTATALCFAASAQTTAAAGTDAKARYERERAACLNGTSHQDRATCLQEAGAALNEARHGRLTTSDQLKANALSRCNGLPEADRDDCRSRVNNESNSTAKGTVEGGGVIKETTTRWETLPNGEKRQLP